MKKTQTGRSMVEMLGVLVIIGVLSVAWIPAYSLVMNRYRANRILDMASKVAIAAQTINGGHGGCVAVVAENGTIPGDCNEGAPFVDTGLVWTPISGVTGFLADASNDAGANEVVVYINVPPENVQKTMHSIAGDNYEIGNEYVIVKTN